MDEATMTSWKKWTQLIILQNAHLCPESQSSPWKCLLTLAQNFVVVCLCDANELAVVFDGFHDPLVVELFHGGCDAEAVPEAEGGRRIVCCDGTGIRSLLHSFHKNLDWQKRPL